MNKQPNIGMFGKLSQEIIAYICGWLDMKHIERLILCCRAINKIELRRTVKDVTISKYTTAKLQNYPCAEKVYIDATLDNDDLAALARMPIKELKMICRNVYSFIVPQTLEHLDLTVNKGHELDDDDFEEMNLTNLYILELSANITITKSIHLPNIIHLCICKSFLDNNALVSLIRENHIELLTIIWCDITGWINLSNCNIDELTIIGQYTNASLLPQSLKKLSITHGCIYMCNNTLNLTELQLSECTVQAQVSDITRMTNIKRIKMDNCSCDNSFMEAHVRHHFGDLFIN